MIPPFTLVLGGVRSGKSAHAERLVEALPAPWIYAATAEALDDEMRARIARHRARRDERWLTEEVPLALPALLAATTRPVLVDCLTLWLSNLMLAGHDVAEATSALEAALVRMAHPAVLVSNEVGLGGAAENSLMRRFADEQGRLNQRLAARADHVVLLVAGLPMVLK